MARLCGRWFINDSRACMSHDRNRACTGYNFPWQGQPVAWTSPKVAGPQRRLNSYLPSLFISLRGFFRNSGKNHPKTAYYWENPMSIPQRVPKWWKPYAAEFPDWRVHKGENLRYYARLPGTDPLVIVHAEDAVKLREEIIRTQAKSEQEQP